MKKVWKIIISLILILVIGGAGTAYHFFNVKTYDVADEEVEKITATEYDILLPDEDGSSEAPEKIAETETEAASNNNNKETSAGQKDSDEIDRNASSNDSTREENNNNSTTGKDHATSSTENTNKNKPTEVTVASIKQKYYPSFEHLQSQANGKIDALISQAYGEYQTKKKNGESISVAYFYQKYSSAGKVLEGNTDAAFNMIYGALQDDLKKNGFSTSHAESFKEEYNATKKARESALMNKVKEAL